MMSILDKLASFIAPLECLKCGAEDTVLCNNCTELYMPRVLERCIICKRFSRDFETCKECRKLTQIGFGIWVSNYGAISQKIINNLKYFSCRATTYDIAKILDIRLPYLPSESVIVPIPTSRTRIKRRGFDQTIEIAKNFCHLRNLHYYPMLERTGKTRQLGNTRTQRLKQLDGQFSVKNTVLPKSTNIILIDDIVTTGATIITAEKSLRKAGYKNISVICFARP